MAAPTYLKINGTTGQNQEAAATETGPANEVIVSTTSSGTIDPSLLPASGTVTYTAGEALAAGDFVYIKSDGDAWKATWASGGNEAIGFVLAGVLISASATVYSQGINSSLSSLTVGARYFGDSATPGAATATIPTGTGKLLQFLGYAVSTTAIEFNPEDATIRA